MSRAFFSLHLVLSVAVAVTVATTAAQGARAENVVGAVGAANGTLTGHLPSGPVRTLAPGASVFFKDRISTRHGGSAQLVFLDRSTLDVGANSDVTIDEFVYRPGAGGTMKARLTRGILRFVGGDISHQGGTTIETPAVTIGIRGGIGTIGYLSDAHTAAGLPGVPAGFHRGTIVINGYGALTVRNAASEVTITKPGFGVFVGGAGEAIGTPVPIDAATAQILMRAATSHAGQRGGLSARAASLAAAGLARAAVAPATPPASAPQPILAPNVLDFTAIVSGSAALARDRSQARQTVQAIQQLHIATPPATLPISGPPTSGSSSPAPESTGSTSSGGSSSGSTPTGSTSSGGSPPSGPTSSGSSGASGSTSSGGSPPSGPTSSGSSGASGSTSSGGSPPGPAGPGLPPVDPPPVGGPLPPVTIPVVGPILRGHDNGIGNGGQNNGVGNLGHPGKGPNNG